MRENVDARNTCLRMWNTDSGATFLRRFAHTGTLEPSEVGVAGAIRCNGACFHFHQQWFVSAWLIVLTHVEMEGFFNRVTGLESVSMDL